MTVAEVVELDGERRAFGDPTYVPRTRGEEIAKRNGELLRAMMRAVPVEGKGGFPKEGGWGWVVRSMRRGNKVVR